MEVFKMRVDTAQGMSSTVPDLAREEAVIKPVDTEQPVQHVPAIQQGDQHEGVVVKEVVIKQVNTAQPAQQVTARADTTQPVQHAPAKQQGDKYEGVVVREVAIKQVNTAQPAQHVPAIQQAGTQEED